ncbi:MULTISPECIES: metal ABC transporter permease [Paenibacillus]|uniref:metal ABC transporter permease n=1 Tax=Paenibacillus TaxID=44249 RepID=UPI001788896E|nr:MULTISPECIES: metal ABC transporter permease [Paenibacillus]QOT12072.1 metal ABC transporter permease [Paenibacillus sp. JNUCC-32]WFB55846.1 metal ABC transporter permease [Paenibacillus sp. BR1-192]GIP03421.1 zinc ABC transporter permease [Paenibacillus lautus]
MAMLGYEFMQRAFWAGGLIGVIGPVLGVFLMLRRQVLMADTLSHVSLAGVALGSFLKLNPALSGFAMAMIGALVIEQLRRVYRTYTEVPVAIIMTSGLALSVVLMSLNQNLSKSFSSYLFGSIVAVSDTQLRLIAVVAAVGMIFFVGLRRPLYNFAFDEETAAASGMRVSLLSFLFAVFTGMTVAAAMPVVGVLLVSALIVLPASIALRMATGFLAAMGIAVVVGLSGVFSGLAASYYLNTPPGGTIALILLGFLIMAVIFQKLLRLQNRRSIQKINRNRSHKNYEEI